MARENEYIFYNINDILIFVDWLRNNFQSADEYSEWFDSSLETYVPSSVFCTRKGTNSKEVHQCQECDAKFFTAAGLDVHNNVLHKKDSTLNAFWEIINNEYKKENHDHELPNTD